MKKSERIKVLEEKVEELSNANHEMEMKLSVAMAKLSDAMDRINSLRKDTAILQSEVNYVKEQ